MLEQAVALQQEELRMPVPWDQDADRYEEGNGGKAGRIVPALFYPHWHPFSSFSPFPEKADQMDNGDKKEQVIAPLGIIKELLPEPMLLYRKHQSGDLPRNYRDVKVEHHPWLLIGRS